MSWDLLNSVFMMSQLSLLVWNVKGAGGANFMSSIKELIGIHRPSVLALVEPRISGLRADEVCDRLGYDGLIRVEAQVFAGGLWLLWNSASILVTLVRLDPQHITVEVVRRDEEPWILTAIYASPISSDRLHLWEDLAIFAEMNNLPWLLAGDFNATLTSLER